MTDPEIHSSEIRGEQTPSGAVSSGDAGEPFRPLIFGEALFDYFPDGTRVLGGAPFNVAWHLRGFKADPLMITAVGRDRDGEEILNRMEFWGMDTRGVQLHPTRPTGRVTAHLEGDQPHYDIEAGQAYDAMTVEALPPPGLLERADLLYHGSLGLREEASARTLAFLRDRLNVPVFVDVNLRDPWWGLERTPAQIRGAEWVKVNLEEAALLSGRSVATEEALLSTLGFLRTWLACDGLVVTLGAEGALAVSREGITRSKAERIADTVDTVGAGDAFSAVLALGIHNGWPFDRMLERAAVFAGELCRIRGAIPSDPDLYDRHMRRWNDAS